MERCGSANTSPAGCSLSDLSIDENAASGDRVGGAYSARVHRAVVLLIASAVVLGTSWFVLLLLPMSALRSVGFMSVPGLRR